MEMRGHTGVVITFGIWVLTYKTSKQKINSRISNESEVIDNCEYLKYNIWYEQLMEAQGYSMKSNI